jgi:hypothetical protein
MSCVITYSSDFSVRVISHARLPNDITSPNDRHSLADDNARRAKTTHKSDHICKIERICLDHIRGFGVGLRIIDNLR